MPHPHIHSTAGKLSPPTHPSQPRARLHPSFASGERFGVIITLCRSQKTSIVAGESGKEPVHGLYHICTISPMTIWQQRQRHQAPHHRLQHWLEVPNQQNSHGSTQEKRARARRGWHGFLPGRGRIQLSSSTVAVPPCHTGPSQKPLGFSPTKTVQAVEGTPSLCHSAQPCIRSPCAPRGAWHHPHPTAQRLCKAPVQVSGTPVKLTRCLWKAHPSSR